MKSPYCSVEVSLFQLNQPVQAQTEQALSGWQLSLGWQDYSEQLMNLKGP